MNQMLNLLYKLLHFKWCGHACWYDTHILYQKLLLVMCIQMRPYTAGFKITSNVMVNNLSSQVFSSYHLCMGKTHNVDELRIKLVSWSWVMNLFFVSNYLKSLKLKCKQQFCEPNKNDVPSCVLCIQVQWGFVFTLSHLDNDWRKLCRDMAQLLY